MSRTLFAGAVMATIAVQSYALHAPSFRAPSAVKTGIDANGHSLLNRRDPTQMRSMALRGGEAKPWYDAFWNESVELAVLFGLWYWGNAYYNITNKRALNALGGAKGGLVWFISTFQLFVGVLWVVPLWLTGLRKFPAVTFENFVELFPVGVFAAGNHAGSVLGLGAGAVSFAQILKACEPVFSAANEVVFLGDVQAWQVYLTLIPIIGGVALASIKELSFSWLAVISCMIANQCAALKAVIGKGVMKKPWAKAMGPSNQYGIVNIASWIVLLPIALFLEGPKAVEKYNSYIQKGANKNDVLFNTFASGFAFYLYNEVSFMALNKVSPVTHSVANTLKRIVIIIASCIVLGDKMTFEGAIGSVVAVGGTLLYSLAKTKYGGAHH